MAGHSSAFLDIVNDAKSKIKQIDSPELAACLAADPQAVLIDTREDSEFAAAHVVGAVHMGKGVIERDIEAKVPNKDTALYLYCGGGFRSALAAEAIQRMGYTNAINVDGGWRSLKELMPTE
jgi:rhodanese-related sulfurtransferase